MAVLAMNQIRICALTRCREPLMELVQRRGVVQLRDELPHDEVFARPDIAASCAQLQRCAQTAGQALEILDRYAPAAAGLPVSLKGLPRLNAEQLQECAARREELEAAASCILRREKELADARAAVSRLQVQIGSLTPWMSLSVPLNFEGTRCTRVWIGSFSGNSSAAELLQRISVPGDTPLELIVLSSSREQTCVFVLGLRAQADSIETALRRAGFSLPAVTCSLPPAEQKSAWEAEIAENNNLIAEHARELSAMSEKRPDLQLLMDWCNVSRENRSALAKLAQSRHVFVAEGYIPARDAPALQKELQERFSASVELADPDPESDPPVALENSAFSAPMENVLSSYSYPGRGEFDPSFMMALFYYFLFGMMLSDAGYGLLMVLACGILLAKFPNMQSGLRKSLTMFLYGGISTVFWGVLYGSWFGDAPDVIARTFLHSDFTLQPVWVNPINCPMQMLMFCLLIGLIHLYTGLGCKAWLTVKSRDWGGFAGDVLAWYLLVSGLILFALSSPAFIQIVQLNFILPAAVGTVGKWIAVTGAVMVVLLGGRDSKNPALRLVKGLYALYGSTSWLGDLLSYSRLLALGLATGVVGQVVNQMASMGGDSPFGIVLFIVVFLIGHSMNMAINLLGAYVHTNRLQFVEFFGKFYEGGGTEFEPLAVHTQYYQFSEVK